MDLRWIGCDGRFDQSVECRRVEKMAKVGRSSHRCLALFPSTKPFVSFLYFFIYFIFSFDVLVIQSPPDIKSAAIYGVELVLWIGIMLAGLWFKFRSLDSRSSSAEGEAVESVISSPVVRRDSTDRRDGEFVSSCREADRQAQIQRLERNSPSKAEIFSISLSLCSLAGTTSMNEVTSLEQGGEQYSTSVFRTSATSLVDPQSIPKKKDSKTEGGLGHLRLRRVETVS